MIWVAVAFFGLLVLGMPVGFCLGIAGMVASQPCQTDLDRRQAMQNLIESTAVDNLRRPNLAKLFEHQLVAGIDHRRVFHG